MVLELEERAPELQNSTVSTIYFGGGTPSLLDATDLRRFFDVMQRYYHIGTHPEITLEANPDDLTPAVVHELRNSPVNRLSIGVQSFREKDLKAMNRAHNAREAESAVKRSQDAGITNISIDLMYGLPGLNAEQWGQNLDRVFQLNVPHLSAYGLTVEPGTALAHQIKKGHIPPLSDADAAHQFRQLHKAATQHGYEHYEVSNLAFPDMHSRHNSNYWLGVPYLGIGPSAHSYDGQKRSWNIAHNLKYMEGMQNKKRPHEVEHPDQDTAYNEYILTRLRTKWGCNEKDIRSFYGDKAQEHFLAHIQKPIEAGHVNHNDASYTLSLEGMLMADRIAARLFL